MEWAEREGGGNGGLMCVELYERSILAVNVF